MSTPRRFSALLALLALFALAHIFPAARAGDGEPEFFRWYSVLDLAECLDEFKEREFFEAMQARVFEDGTADSKFMLGLLHHHGLGTPRDAARAARWYGEAAAAGYRFRELGDEAARALTALTKNGTPTPAAPDPALAAMIAAAERDGADEQLRLATRFQHGLCAPLDWEEAMRWEIRAAENGSLEAAKIVGDSFYLGLNAYPQDLSRALPWLEALAEKGDAVALLAVGDAYRQGLSGPPDEAKALAMYEKAAALDSLRAWQRLYEMHSQGLAGAAPDEEKLAFLRDQIDAAKRFEKAVAAGPPRKLSDRALELYREGLACYGTADDADADFRAGLLYLNAAAFGVEEADNYYRLGLIQEEGRAGIPNPFGAGKSYRTAALLGHADAMLRLARLHEEGRGVRRSLARAAHWYRAAEKAGVAEASGALRAVEDRLAAGHREEWEDSPDFARLMEDARYRATFRLR